jgi:hypothetical protein
MTAPQGHSEHVEACIQLVVAVLRPRFPKLVRRGTSLLPGRCVVRSIEDQFALAAAVQERFDVFVDMSRCTTIDDLAREIAARRAAPPIRRPDDPDLVATLISRPAVRRGELGEVDRLRSALHSVGSRAEGLPWRSRHAWNLSTHVRRERGVLCVDLHGLSCSLTSDALEIARQAAAGTTVRFVHGQGRHSEGRGKLRELVRITVGAWVTDGRARLIEQADGHIDLNF